VGEVDAPRHCGKAVPLIARDTQLGGSGGSASAQPFEGAHPQPLVGLWSWVCSGYQRTHEPELQGTEALTRAHVGKPRTK
jgi:hypothetical protein